MTRTALIVGAGIGGLSAGVALRRAGWHVRIFERAASPRELGFGLAIAPNAVAALRDLDIADVVMARAFSPTSAEVRRMDGKVFKRMELPPMALGGPLLIALRPALHGALLEAVGADAITPSSEAIGFALRGDQVTLQLARGGSAEGDVLIGADGAGSAIRRTLHPQESPPRPANIVAVRGAVHGAIHHLGDLSAIYYLGRGVESAIVRASDTGIYWYLSLTRELVPLGMTDARAVVSLMAPKFDATFRAVTAMTSDLRFDELFDRDPIPSWGAGVVTLLGDAAHPVLPHTGQGAAQAIVDAVTLGKALGGVGTGIEPALRAYERERRGKTATLLKQGRRTARMMRTTNPLACALRDTFIRLIPATTIAKLLVTVNRKAGTDVTTDA